MSLWSQAHVQGPLLPPSRVWITPSRTEIFTQIHTVIIQTSLEHIGDLVLTLEILILVGYIGKAGTTLLFHTFRRFQSESELRTINYFQELKKVFYQIFIFKGGLFLLSHYYYFIVYYFISVILLPVKGTDWSTVMKSREAISSSLERHTHRNTSLHLQFQVTSLSSSSLWLLPHPVRGFLLPFSTGHTSMMHTHAHLYAGPVWVQFFLPVKVSPTGKWDSSWGSLGGFVYRLIHLKRILSFPRHMVTVCRLLIVSFQSIQSRYIDRTALYLNNGSPHLLLLEKKKTAAQALWDVDWLQVRMLVLPASDDFNFVVSIS